MRIAFVGNCQVESCAVSAKYMLDAAEISMFDYSQPYSKNEEERRRYAGGRLGLLGGRDARARRMA